MWLWIIIKGEGGRATPGCTVKVGTLIQTSRPWVTGFGGNISESRLDCVSPLGPQCLSSQFDLEPQLRGRPRHRDRFGLRGFNKAVVLPLVLLVFFVLPLVKTVQTGVAFICRGRMQLKSLKERLRCECKQALVYDTNRLCFHFSQRNCISIKMINKIYLIYSLRNLGWIMSFRFPIETRI